MSGGVEEYICRGPDAGQLVGFLCSLGLLEAATRSVRQHDVRLGFTWHEVGFRPVLTVEPEIGRETLVQRLHAWLGNRATSPELNRLGDDLPCDPTTFEALAREMLEYGDRASTALLASLGVAGRDPDRLDDTGFRTMSGAGHQRFLEFARQIAEQTTAEQLQSCLFERWTYEDPKPSLRFDPADDRRYAVRADNPSNASSSAPIQTVRGANALAFEGLALVPVVPRSGGVSTTLMSREGRELSVRWPLWSRPITRDAAASALTVRSPRAGHGVMAVFRARRITVGKFRSFTPAERVQ